MDVPATMKAAFIRERGPVDKIEYGDLPTPQPGPGEVLVRVQAVAVNPVDTLVRSGAFPTQLPFPFVLGRDLVGVVAAAGNRVTHFHLDQRVWSNSLGHDGRQGSFAEYVCVPEERTYALPSPVDSETAVAAFHPAATAYAGLVQHAGIRPSDVVFVGGGAGNVGSAVLQLAYGIGCRVLVSVHGREDTAWCREHGAEAVMDYQDANLAAQVRAAASHGVDVHWDTSGQHDLDQAAEMLAFGGRVLLTAGARARPPVPVGPMYWKNARILGFVISNARVDNLAEAAVTINRMLAMGTLVPRITEVMPLSQAAEAHRRMETGQVRGRLVLRPHA